MPSAAPALGEKLVGVGRPPPNPASWTVASWFVDNAGSTLCASDSNTCTSATCGAAGSLVGPCSTAAEIASRWRTSSPTLAQGTRITFLSDDSEPTFDLTPILVFGGSFVITGTFTVVGSGTVGTVTAKNRAANQPLTANLGQAVAPFIGLIFSDTTRGSYAWLDSASSGNVATLSQPFSHDTDCASNPSELDTVASGDAYQILRPTKVPIRSFNPVFRTNVYFGIASGRSCLEHVWILDPSGTPGVSGFDLNISSPMCESRVDPGTFFRIGNQPQEPEYHFNSFWNGGMQSNASTQNAPGIIGGDIYSSESQGGNIANNGGFILDGDVIVHGFTLMANGPGTVGAAYVKSHLVLQGSVIQLVANVAGPALWGPGTLTVGPNTTLLLESTTATASLLLAGGVNLGDRSTITTACGWDTSVDPAVLHCGRTLTPAHIDGSIASGGFGGSAVDPWLQTTITVER